jgi:hypothetical protein
MMNYGPSKRQKDKERLKKVKENYVSPPAPTRQQVSSFRAVTVEQVYADNSPAWRRR